MDPEKLRRMEVINTAPFNPGRDSDITIINPSMINDENHSAENYVPILDRLKQASRSSELNDHYHEVSAEHRTESNTTRSRVGDAPIHRSDFIIVEHHPEENAQQLEQVLRYYVRDLKEPSRTQLECVQQLVIRLIDLIRPAYSTNQQKMIELDRLLQEISSSHDQRHVEQKEKLEVLHMENSRLQKLLFDASNHTSLALSNRNYSLPCTENPDTNVEQWTEIEDDAKKLQEIVEAQRYQINEIVHLINQQGLTNPRSPSPTNEPRPSLNPETPAAKTEETEEQLPSPDEVFEDIPSASLPSTGPSLLDRVKNFVRPSRSLVNHSPGTSPSESLATMTLSTVNPTSPPEPNHSVDKETCPACQTEFTFSNEADRTAMHEHFQRCLFPSQPPSPAPKPTEYSCPKCERKYLSDDETDYLQHLDDCYNRD